MRRSVPPAALSFEAVSDPAAATVLASSAALALAGLLAFAGVAKATRRAATEQSFRELHLRWPRGLSVLVPAVEGLVAGACVVRPAVGGWCALFLLSAFTAVLAPVVRSGRRISCRCFGAASGEPVTSTTLVRNGLLIACALATTTVERLSGGLVVALIAAGAVMGGAVILSLADTRRVTGRLV